MQSFGDSGSAKANVFLWIVTQINKCGGKMSKNAVKFSRWILPVS